MRLWFIYFASLSAFAANLHVPEQFDLRRVNGVEQTTWLARDKVVPLRIGRNEIEMEFDQMYDAAIGDGHDRIQSQPFIVVVEVANTNEQWQIIAENPRTRDAAVRYAKQPVYSVRQIGSTTTPEAHHTEPTVAISPKPITNTTPPPVDVMQMLQYWWQLATPEQRQAFLQTVQKN